jgi:YbbR domain-containing protein
VRIRFGTLLLSFLIAAVLWGMAHGTSSIDRGVDIPVVFDGIPEDLVITEKTADAINIRVLGSRSALRNVSPTKMDYRIDVSGSKRGRAVFEVDVSRIELPRGATVVSRSPASIEVEFERRGRKAVRVRPDLEGQPAEGYRITAVEIDPPRVWLTGARRDVLRLTEVVTETIDVAGLAAPVERQVRLSLGSDHVWREEQGTVTVRIQVDPEPAPDLEDLAGERAGEGEAAGAVPAAGRAS